ncbi:MAG: Uma2 family endonuclease [Planctomycetota bacterium]
MIARLRAGPYTFAEFLELIPEDQKADLIEGNILMASPENIEHNDLLFWLGKVLGIYIDERGLGKLSVNKVAYRLTDDTAPEPDLAFLRTERLGLRKRGYVDGPPDVAIEIVSPDSVERDYELKRRHYEAAGVSEYWIIDPEERRATLLVRAGDHFEPAPPAADVFESRAIPGFRLDLRWLWQRPLPSPLATVQSLLRAAS